MEELDAISNPIFVTSRLCAPTSIHTYVFTILMPFVSSQLQLPLMGFDGAGNDKLLKVLHEIVEEDKGKKLTLGGFRSPPDAKDTEGSPLHMIFDLKKVLFRKEYFKINHLLPLPFNLTWGCTLLGKNVVPRLALKEFLLRCL
jgi:hypothetical protein